MIRLPRPRLLHGIEMIAAEPSPEQEAAVAELVRRAERIRSGSVDPREDNMLAITNDGRKVALDMRVMDPTAPDFPGSKTNLLVQHAFLIWQESQAERLTQLIFCDLSKPVPPERGFSVYNDISRKLTALGVPPAEIAFIHDANTDAKKARLFADVREGRVRILLGSTQKMGMGTNVQDRLYALHHLDAPWGPAPLCLTSTRTRSSPAGTGRGLNKSQFAKEKTAVFRPIASPSERTAPINSPGLRRRPRTATQMSRHRSSSERRRRPSRIASLCPSTPPNASSACRQATSGLKPSWISRSVSI
jgi:hypothetical protein